jgi:hypothetical protein
MVETKERKGEKFNQIAKHLVEKKMEETEKKYNGKTYEEVCEENLSKHPDKEVYLRLLKIRETICDYKLTGESFPEIDENQFKNDLTCIKQNQDSREKAIPWISSNQEDWFPPEIVDLIRWINGGNNDYPYYRSLGHLLAIYDKHDFLKILAESGDKKAKLIKVRNRLPKELLGKKLEYIKLEDGTWMVSVSEADTRCWYEKYREEC